MDLMIESNEKVLTVKQTLDGTVRIVLITEKGNRHGINLTDKQVKELAEQLGRY